MNPLGRTLYSPYTWFAPKVLSKTETSKIVSSLNFGVNRRWSPKSLDLGVSSFYVTPKSKDLGLQP